MQNGWGKVGEWLKGNAGAGVALVGSLLTGNMPGAVAAGVALVSSATGTTDPTEALAALQGNPELVVRLKELAIQDEGNIRAHIQKMAELELTDKQAEHHETQETIRAGDKAEDLVVRWTRPLQSWCSLLASFGYAFMHGVTSDFDLYLIGMFLTLPWAYAGLREFGKGLKLRSDQKIAIATAGA